MDPTKSGSSSTTKKWLLGCGIGCGALIIIAAIVIISGVFFVKNLVKGFEESEALMNTLVEKYGEVSDFQPNPDGTIPAQRMEAFLAVRDSGKATRQEIEQTIRNLARDDDDEADEESRPSGVFGKIRAGLGLVPMIAEYFMIRNQSLLDKEMGIGEYYYLSIISYYSWLKKPVLESSPFNWVADGGGGMQYRWGGNEDDADNEIHHDLILREFHGIILGMLKNQLEGLSGRESTSLDLEWKQALELEIKAMEDNRYRLVWEGGPHARITDSLEPFRSRLLESYSPLFGAIEFNRSR